MWTSAKRASVFIIYFLELFSGILACVTVKLLASKLGISKRFRYSVGALNCLTGGVFFAISILSLLPEARESIEQVFKHLNIDSDYPVTECLVGVGFLLILFLETTIRLCCHGNQSVEKKTGFRRRNNIFGSSSVVYTRVKQDDYKTDEESDPGIKVEDFEDSSWVDDGAYFGYGAVDDSVDIKGNLGTNKKHVNDQYVTQEREFQAGDKSIIHDKEILQDNAIEPSQDSQKRKSGAKQLRGIILLTALSLHMVFDGISLGLLSTDNKVWALLLALSVHKVLVFFTIGVQVYEMFQSVKKTVALTSLIALVSPIGICIGVAVTNNVDDFSKNVSTGILQGIATGTFLYVTFFEILQKELDEKHSSFLKVLITVVGFSMVAAVRLLENENHGSDVTTPSHVEITTERLS